MQSHQTKLILIVLGIILGVVALIVLIVSPLLSKVSEIQNRTLEGELKLQAIAADIANYKLLSSHLAKVAKQKEELAAMFPSRENMVSLVQGIESAIQSAKLINKLTIVDNQEKKEQKSNEQPTPPIVAGTLKLEEVPYTLQVSGNYRGISDLFFYIEHLPFITILDKLSLAADQVQAEGGTGLRNTGTATMKIEGLLFMLKP